MKSFLSNGFYSFKRHRFFTLAEVLITLAVIGVLSAMSIPGLLNSIKENDYNVGVKKASAVLSQAVMMIQNNNGTVRVGGMPQAYIRDDLCSVMSWMKRDNVFNIFGPTKYKFYKTSTDSNFPDSNSPNYPGAVLNDGSFIATGSWDSGCNNYNVNACGYIVIDINGSKGPKMWGKDLYFFHIVLNNGVYSILPAGYPGDGIPCITGNGDNAAGCTYKRLTDPDHMP